MKKLFALLLSLCLSLSAAPAWAAQGDATPFARQLNGFNDSLTSATVADGVIYAASYNGLYRYAPGDETPDLFAWAQNDQGTPNVHALFARDGKPYGIFMDWSMSEGETEKVTAYVSEIRTADATATLGDHLALDWDAYTQASSSQYGGELSNPVVIADCLYMQSTDYDTDARGMVSFSLTDGSYQAVAAPELLSGIAPYKEGKLLCSIRTSKDDWSAPLAVATLDPTTGATEELFRIEQPSHDLCGLAYDEVEDAVLYVLDGEILRVDHGDVNGARVVNAIPLQNSSSTPRFGHLLPGNLYMFYNYDGMAVLSFLIAMLLGSLRASGTFFRNAVLMPYLMPTSAMLLIWLILFDYGGPINRVVVALGLERVLWLEGPALRAPVVVMYLWKNLGFSVVIFTAALQAVPEAFYEYARLEGAGFLRRAFSITLPLITPTAFLVFVMAWINAFKIFKEVYFIGGAYPDFAVYTLQNYMNNMFSKLNYQMVTTAAYSFALIVLVLFGALFLLEKGVRKGVNGA